MAPPIGNPCQSLRLPAIARPAAKIHPACGAYLGATLKSAY
jgi:hypothetical protein